jgi:hypothetical protein
LLRRHIGRATATRTAENIDEKSPEELFAEFYALQNGVELSEDKISVVKKAFEEGARDII